MYQRPFLIIAFCILLTSCSIGGIFTDYNKLSKQEKENVVTYAGNISDIRDYTKIYKITVEQVKQYISEKKNVVVYDYVPFCRSENCVSPKILINEAKLKGYDALIITNTYLDAFIAVGNDFPLLVIDNSKYNTKLRGKYTDLFYQNLLGVSLKSINYASYNLFKEGKYTRSYKNSKDIQ